MRDAEMACDGGGFYACDAPRSPPNAPRNEPASHVSLQSTWLQKPGCHICYKELFRELLCDNRLRERAEKAARKAQQLNLKFIRRSSPAAPAPLVVASS